jgi:hypothetical protein
MWLNISQTSVWRLLDQAGCRPECAFFPFRGVIPEEEAEMAMFRQKG